MYLYTVLVLLKLGLYKISFRGAAFQGVWGYGMKGIPRLECRKFKNKFCIKRILKHLRDLKSDLLNSLQYKENLKFDKYTSNIAQLLNIPLSL